MNAPVRTIPNPDEIIAVVRNQADMVEAFRRMKSLLGLTNAHCDELANMTEGHTDKCLGPTCAKEIGALTFSRFCWLFAVKFEMRIDLEQMRVMAEHWDDRQRKRPIEHSGNPKISKKLIERAKPIVFSEMGKRSAPARMACLTAEHRSKIARKAAKSRWKKAKRKPQNGRCVAV